MNKVIEKAKDLFYDTTDYILILIIIATVAGIIAWRLDLLFDKSSKPNPNTRVEVSSSNSSDNNIKNDSKDKNESTDKITVSEKDKQSNELIEKEKDKQKGVIVNIVIPDNTLPDGVAGILLDAGLITDKSEFLIKSQELGLDVKFRSGKYDINKNSSLEDIIRIIARQQ